MAEEAFSTHSSIMRATMAPNREQFLRQQIAESFRQASEQIDRQVAQALSNPGQFGYAFTSEELAVVFANIFFTLIDTHKFAGLTVPLIHNVAQMDVQIKYPCIAVQSLLHIHSPIKAFINVDYELGNHPYLSGALTFDQQSLKVKERTGRLDLIAKAALSAIDVEGVVRDELKDPAQVIRKTLPHRLKSYGFDGTIGRVRLEVTPDNRLQTLLVSGDSKR